MQNITLAKDIDTSVITFAPKAKGATMVFLNHNKKPLIVQFPEMYCPFGMSSWDTKTKDGNATCKFTIDLSLEQEDKRTPSLAKAYNNLVTLDNLLVDSGVENSLQWLGNSYEPDDRKVVKALYSDMVRFSKDKDTGKPVDKYAPRLSIKVPVINGTPNCEVFDSTGQPMPIELEKGAYKGCRMTVVARMSGVWLVGGKFGCSWQLVQMIVKPPASIRGLAIQADEDDINDIEDNDEDDLDDAELPTRKKPSTDIPDSESEGGGDNDDEDEEEEEPLPAQPPVKPKKRVVRRAA